MKRFTSRLFSLCSSSSSTSTSVILRRSFWKRKPATTKQTTKTDVTRAEQAVPTSTTTEKKYVPIHSLFYSTPSSDAFRAQVPLTPDVHSKTPMELIAEVPVIEVDAAVAVCDGGHAQLGHPVEFIQLNTADPEVPQTCKYCGLRYIMKKGHVHYDPTK
eukprot:TRINITY_DN186_c0_g1_i2.p1 TRINITY_DN186_c0_g1~~TRINITY_DN186_c0_g1_i2.p1  ORF type:complete len:159 (+),score=37.07 TRINITY_DN186_c0_g1_i2:60-536(+)